MKKLFLAALAPVAALPLALGAGAGAATSWETFGSASAAGRGQWTDPMDGEGVQKGWASFEVTSVTKTHVAKVRTTVTDGSFTGLSTVNLSLYCHDKGSRVWNNTDTGYKEVSLPKTFTWDPPTWVNVCQVRVEAHHSSAAGTTNGPLAATLQATYP
jgi:hypothetical protein